jgi:uncharacterized protein (TIGR03083 family)
MAGMAEIYDGIRRDISEVVSSLDDDELQTPVPATPDWSIKDVIAHLIGGAEGALASDFPREFFDAFGDPDAVRKLNTWTTDHVAVRRDEDMATLLDEWAKHSAALAPLLEGEASVSPALPPFGDRIMVTDAGTHQQDIYGALSLERGRDAAPVKIGSASFVGMMDIRMRKAGAPALVLDAGEKVWTVGGDGAEGSVRTTRFEFFRSLSGRRSPDQVRAYEWSVDPEPYLDFFYPYGARSESLVE